MSIILLLSACNQPVTKSGEAPRPQKKADYAIVIHGGAGTITRANMTPQLDSTYRATMNAVLDQAEKLLHQGSDALDVAESCIIMMEDSPLFNAGKGAVLTHEAKHELDASVMHGASLNAGAVSGVSTVKNPISAARAVLEKSEHVMLSGDGADQFAHSLGLTQVENAYFTTERRKKSLESALRNEQGTGMTSEDEWIDYKFGTVGAVVLDKSGDIVAATSTGGMTNKKYGRIGDSPIIGSGTYADNRSCGVSCTGHGEYFIRLSVAHAVSQAMKHGDLSLEEAADLVIHTELQDLGGTGGLIALDSYGNVAMPFNTEGMYRAYLKPGERVVKIYKGE